MRCIEMSGQKTNNELDVISISKVESFADRMDAQYLACMAMGGAIGYAYGFGQPTFVGGARAAAQPETVYVPVLVGESVATMFLFFARFLWMLWRTRCSRRAFWLVQKGDVAGA